MDYLRGLKENVIVGRLIPAGTGMEHYHQFHMEEEEYEVLPEEEDDLFFDFSEEDIRALPAEALESE